MSARQPSTVQAALLSVDEHPLIRPLDDYARVVAAAAARKVGPNPGAPRSPGEATVRFTRQGRANECAPEKQHSQQHGQQQNPGPPVADQGPRDIHPPGSGYSLPGCSPAEPGSA